MHITLYTFSKKNNSTKQPTGGKSVNVRLKENTSVLNPVFILKDDNFHYNYCKWDNRFYFVNDIVSVTNDISEYHCSVDALASWKADIGALSEYILRSAYASDGEIPDMLYPAKAHPTITNKIMSTLHGNFTGGSFVVGIVNGDNDADVSGGIKYYAMSDSMFKDFLSFMFSTPDYLNIDAEEISKTLQKALVNPFQYIRYCKWFPFNIGGTIVNQLKFGWWSYTTTAYAISESDRVVSYNESITLPNHPQVARGQYMNSSPFRRMTANVYNFGRFPVNPALFKSKVAQFTIKTDLYNGQGILTVDNGGQVTNKIFGEVGVDISISQMTANFLQAGTEMLAGATNLLMGNVVGYAQGIASAFESSLPQAQSTGSVGSIAGYKTAPTLLIEDYLAANDSPQHNGRPLCRDGVISSYPGFMIIDNPSVELPCTEQERQMISEYMGRGFYYE